MLIDFSFGNYRSFRDPVTLSLVAANIISENKDVDQNNLIPINPKLNLLTSTAIYGANASGKSNIISAINFMKKLVLNSSRESQSGEKIRVEPFKLSTVIEDQPSYFQVIFTQDNKRYRYGFEVTTKRVEKEWLYTTPTIREAVLFTRVGDEIDINPRSFREGKGLVKKTRRNALFLSVVAQFNGETARNVQGWFRKLRIISGLQDEGYRGYTLNKFYNDEQSQIDIKRFVHALDLDIGNIKVEKINLSKESLPKDMPESLKELIIKDGTYSYTVQTQHKLFDEKNHVIGEVALDLATEESKGTEKLFFLAGPLLDTLENGRVLFIDEMEARMHPKITCQVIKLFNCTVTNPKHAQLVFTTHDTNLLDRNIFRRDQIWFTEKDQFGSSHMYSLVEFMPRNDASFEKDYLQGKYGAIPYLGDFSLILEESRIIAEAKARYDIEET